MTPSEAREKSLRHANIGEDTKLRGEARIANAVLALFWQREADRLEEVEATEELCDVLLG